MTTKLMFFGNLDKVPFLKAYGLDEMDGEPKLVRQVEVPLKRPVDFVINWLTKASSEGLMVKVEFVPISELAGVRYE